MPLDPDRVREAGEKAQSLSKRMDEFMERRKINDAAEDDEDEDELEEEELEEEENELREPAEEALRQTPGSDLDNSDINEPWFK